MVKRERDSEKESSNSSSLASLASETKKKILDYSNSSEIEKQLIGFNSVLALGTLAFIFAGFLTHGNSDFMGKIIIFFFCIVFAGVAGVLYLPIIEFSSGFVKNDIFGLKLSIAMLICALNITFFGFYLDNLLFLQYGFAILFIQIVALAVIGYLKIPVETKIKQKANDSLDIWVILDKISIISGLINFVVWGIGLFLTMNK